MALFFSLPASRWSRHFVCANSTDPDDASNTHDASNTRARDAFPTRHAHARATTTMPRATRTSRTLALLLAVLAVAAVALPARAASSAVTTPRARFQRHDASALGGWRKKLKKSVKKTTKTVTKTTESVTKTVTKTTADMAKDAYAAGKAMAGSTYQATYNNVKNKFGDKVTKFTGDSKDMLENKYDATKGFTSDAVSTIKSEASALAADATAVAEMIVAFFNGLKCDISPSTMRDIAYKLKNKAFQNGGTSSMVEQIKADPAKFYQKLDNAACDIIWNTMFTSASAAIDVFKEAIETLKEDCPAIGGAKSAFTLGLTLDVDVTFGTHTAGIGTELGVGFDLVGNKFCYVGACASSGRKFGGNPLDADAEPGLALSGYKEMSSVPGECSLIDAGLSINLPTPLKIEGEGGLTYLYSGGLGNFVGVQVPLAISQAAMVPGAEVSFSKGMCCTPICIKTDGSDCAGTNWKNPCPTAKDPTAWENLITASAEARLGGATTLDRSNEEYPGPSTWARRLGYDDDVETSTQGALRSKTVTALAASIGLIAIIAVAAQRRRRSKLVADETTPLVRSS